MQTAIRAAGNLGAVLAVRTLEEIGLAHAMEIQVRRMKFKRPINRVSRKFSDR